MSSDTRMSPKSVLISIALATAALAVATPMLQVQWDPNANRSGGLAKVLLLYAQDNDGVFPLAMSQRQNGGWRFSTMHPAPANVIADGPWSEPAIYRSAESMWANVIIPYGTQPEMYRDATQVVHALQADQFRDGVTPLEVGLTFNGFLHTYPKAAVANPNLVPLVWAGNGSVALKGRANANPSLWCDSPAPCRFDPIRGPQAGEQTHVRPTAGALYGVFNMFPYGSVWSARTGENEGGGTIAFVDGSARFQKWGTKFDPEFHTSAADDPFAAVYEDTDGRQGFFFWATVSPDCTDTSDGNTDGPVTYPCYFRPDRTK